VVAETWEVSDHDDESAVVLNCAHGDPVACFEPGGGTWRG